MSKQLFFSLFLSATCVVGLGFSQGHPASQPSSSSAKPKITLDSRFLPASFLGHIQVLAADGLFGREAGTPFSKLAAEYIALQFKKGGLKPVGGDSWFHDFSLPSVWMLQGNPSLRLKGQAQIDLVFRRDFDALPHTGSGKLQGAVVFCGYGISLPESHGGLSYDDYEGKDLKGKIALILQGSPEVGGVMLRAPLSRKIYTAKAKGAAGVLLIVDKLEAFPPSADSSGLPGFQVLRSAAAKVWPAAKDFEGGEEPEGFEGSADIDAQLVSVRKKARNVVGMIPGRDPKLASEFVVLGAHFDHLGLGGPNSLALGGGLGQIHNGADDNASGASMLIEVGKWLANNPQSLRRSVLIVAFSGEEKGLLGSKAFVENPPVPLKSMVAMVNLDMVGRSHEGYCAVIGAGTSPAFPLFFQERAKGGASVRLNDSSFGGSDHQSFHQVGIPAVHFFTGTHSDYHRPGDDWDKITTAPMSWIAGTVADLMVFLSRHEGRPAFKKPISRTPPKKAKSSGARPYLGTIPDYAEGKGGVKLTGATPGSPAEKAGIQKGDVLVKLGEKAIDNIYDFSYALQDLRPGQKLIIVVLRKGKKVPLNLIVGRR
jgi:hypothetical protein